MSDNESDTDRLAAPFETDKPGYTPAMMGQIGSGITFPKNAAESDHHGGDR
jgi:hypothetical protein